MDEPMNLVSHFRELRVYRSSFDAAMRIFELSRNWPAEERYSLTDQIRRSSRSVSANIAEAWRKRRYPNHFISKLSDADAEVAETQNWLIYALGCGYITQLQHDELREAYEALARGLVGMINRSESWCHPADRIREPRGEYVVDTDGFV